MPLNTGFLCILMYCIPLDHWPKWLRGLERQANGKEQSTKTVITQVRTLPNKKEIEFFYCFFFSVIALNFILLVGAFVLNITINIFSVI